jgi:DNA polymerase-4
MAPGTNHAAADADLHPAPPFRKILHVDMDAFYASVEQLDCPELRGKPVAVGGGGPRGVVMAASYEARKYGVRSAMPGGRAARLCSNLVFVPPRFDRYRAVSDQIREIFREHTELVEPLSLDEAYLDVTEDKLGMRSAKGIAEHILTQIRAETGLTASAGVSFNKFLAKMASGYRKPDGLTVIGPDRALEFVSALPIGKFHGIGPATAARFEAIGIHNGADLRQLSEEELVRRFGKHGRFYFRIVRAVDDRKVNPEQTRKSVSVEQTFEQDLIDEVELKTQVNRIAELAWRRLEKTGLEGRTAVLKLRYGDFQTLTRSRSLNRPVSDAEELQQLALQLLENVERRPEGFRLLGVGITGFPEESSDGKQLAIGFE